MDAAEGHERTSLFCEASKTVTAKRIAGVNANPHDIARLDTLWI